MVKPFCGMRILVCGKEGREGKQAARSKVNYDPHRVIDDVEIRRGLL